MAGSSPVGSTPVGSIGSLSLAGKIVFNGSNATSNQQFPNPGKMTFLGSMPVLVTAAPRVTWTGLEVAHGGGGGLRVTWTGLEVLYAGLAAPRVTWMGVEVMRQTATQPTITQVTWFGAEVMDDGAAAERVTWIGVEAAHVGDAANRVTWIGTEVLRSVRDRPPDDGWVCLIAS